MTREKRLSLLKILPGLLVSAFFIWWTYVRIGPGGKRGFDPAAFRGLHIVSPLWLIGVLLFCVTGYTIRCYRFWSMLRNVGARFTVCARVFTTALAANNILPLRIGDVMRVFTYASDMNATPSMVLSTVILEKFLDIFTLAVLFVITMHFGESVATGVRTGAEIGIAISTTGLLVMVFGARTLADPLSRLSAKTHNEKIKKIEHWIMLALDCVRRIGVVGTLMLVVYSFAAWTCEGMMYVSIAKTIGFLRGPAGPWQAAAEANLSFLIPSSPGGIGPFELACKNAMMRHGATAGNAALYGLVVHVWLILIITSVGGSIFLVHRLHLARRESLLHEIETLPAHLP